MSLPEKVAIGPITYDVMRDADIPKYSSAYGQIDFRKQEIRLSSDQGDDQLRDSLLHEVFHGELWRLGLANDERYDERFVHSIATSMLDTLRRNPKMVAFLMSGVEP